MRRHRWENSASAATLSSTNRHTYASTREHSLLPAVELDFASNAALYVCSRRVLYTWYDLCAQACITITCGRLASCRDHSPRDGVLPIGSGDPSIDIVAKHISDSVVVGSSMQAMEAMRQEVMM